MFASLVFKELCETYKNTNKNRSGATREQHPLQFDAYRGSAFERRDFQPFSHGLSVFRHVSRFLDVDGLLHFFGAGECVLCEPETMREVQWGRGADGR